MPATQAPAKAPFMQGSIIWQKKGPLPVWAWAIIGLALAFVVMWWRRNRSAANATEAATGIRNDLPGDQSAPPVWIVPPAGSPSVTVPVNINNPGTVPTAPPGGGAPPPGGALTASVPLGRNVYAWITELNAAHPGLALDFGKLEMFNPGMRKYVQWNDVPGQGWKDPIWYKPSGVPGVPAMRIR